MKILAIIPARGGSKGVPKKNIKNLNGKPLIYWTLKECDILKDSMDILVSTDSQEIADVCEDFGYEVNDLRPYNLSGDNVETLDVLSYEIKKQEANTGFKYDYVLLLQPTCPLRKAHHIKKCLELLDGKFDSIVSIKSVEGDHPFRMKRTAGNKLINFIDQGFEDMRPRQKLPPVYIRNGAIYLTKAELIRTNSTLVGDNCGFYEMNNSDSINIDNLSDFYSAEFIIKNS